MRLSLGRGLDKDMDEEHTILRVGLMESLFTLSARLGRTWDGGSLEGRRTGLVLSSGGFWEVRR